MKTTKKSAGICLSVLLALLCVCTAGGGLTIASADLTAPALQNGYTTTNVASGKRAAYYTVEGEQIPREQLLYFHRTSDSGNADFDPYTALTDGDHDPNNNGGHDIVNVVKPDGGELRTFAVIDLGESYTLTKLNVDLWHDWSYIEVVVQIASQADFSDAVTVYNNDSANEMKQGAGSDPVWVNKSTTGNTIEFTPVVGRYVRASGRSTSGGVIFTEIEAYGVTSGLAPVASNLVGEMQSAKANMMLSTEIDGAKIYYTTDGTIPTEESTEYTAPVALSSFGTEKILVRAVAIKDGVATQPSDFYYNTFERSRNLALGVIPTFDEGVEISFYQTSGSLGAITDGSGNSFNTAHSNKPTWLYLDLGDVHRVNSVVTKFWNDHTFCVIIQTATDAAYTQDLYTVYNNDKFNSVGVGGGVDGEYRDKGLGAGRDAMHVFEFEPVRARYVRVWAADTQESNRNSLWEEIQVWSADKPDEAYDIPVKNVLKGKIPTFDADATYSGNLTFLTDGSGGSYNNFVQFNKTTWLNFDMGKEYTIDKVRTRFWNNHTFLVVIQLAQDADFASGVYTVYNNDTGNSFGAGAGTDPVYTEKGTLSDYFTDLFTEFTFEPVQARYMRVNAISTSEGCIRYEELQAWCVATQGQEIPETKYPTVQRAITKAVGVDHFTVANGATEEDFAEKLPTTFTVEDYYGASDEVTGTWTCDDYDGTTAGDYVYTFAFDDGATYVDLYDVLRVTVTVAAAADRTALKTAIDAADALVQAEYLSDGWGDMTEALAAAKEVHSARLLLQAEADKAETDLKAAVHALVRRGDKTELNALLERAKALTQADYSAASWQALQAKIAEVQTVADNTEVTQTAVDAAKNDLQASVDALERLGDKTALQQKYDQVKDTANVHTQASWTSFAAALENAKEKLDKAEAYEAELTEALTRLETAYDSLVVKADFSALAEAIEAADAVDTADYTSTTAAAFATALAAAKEVAANDESTQATVTAAKDELVAKQNALVAKGDASELKALLASCNYAKGSYTATSYNAYTTAKEEAQTVADDGDAVQADIDEAKTELQAAIDGLKALGDKTALLALLTELENLDEKGYTAASFATLDEAYKYAQSVAASNDVEQSTVDEAVAALTAAREGLQKSGKGGCGSVYDGSLGVISLLLLAVAAALALRKKAAKR